jgi:hypothetical protein
MGLIGKSSNKFREFSCIYIDINSFGLLPLIASKARIDAELIQPNVSPVEILFWKALIGKF